MFPLQQTISISELHRMTISRNILVYLGANAHDALETQLLALSSGIKFIESEIYPERSRAATGTSRPIQFDSHIDFHRQEIGFIRVNDCNHLKVIEAVMSDKHLSLLWTRFGGKVRWRNQTEVKRYEVAYSLSKAAISTLVEEQPAAVVFAYEPHMLPMYIFKKVCDAMGIRTYTLVISPFNWRLFVDTDGQGELTLGLSGKESSSVGYDASVAKFIDEKKGDYNVAKPFYEKRMVRSGIVRRLIYKLRVNRWAPHRLFNAWRACSSYSELSTQRRNFFGSKYVCFFLQLQPEQTTLPDGGLFVHHLFAIQILYAALAPLGVSIVVREHPATFEAAFDAKWRPRNFYESIKKIGPGIHFDNLAEEPYSLIRNAVAVSAVTGTVLLEGLLQGRPAIAFGKHPLKGYRRPSFVDRFNDEVDLRQKISVALAQTPQAIVEDVEHYLHSSYKSSFGSPEYEGNSNMSLDKLRYCRNAALCQVIDVLSDKMSSGQPESDGVQARRV